MCLAVPMKIIEINEDRGIVESLGVKREVGLHLLENPKVNEWVIIHAGFAISKLEEEDAVETLKLMKEGGILHHES